MEAEEVNPMTPSHTFPVALTAKAHNSAERLSQGQPNSLRAKQVYLNGLARFAVVHFLQCMGLETQRGPSDTQLSTGQQNADIAIALLSESTVVSVTDLGQLECCAVLPGEQQIKIPPDAEWGERIGYVAVQLDASLQQAQVIGFSNCINQPGGVLQLTKLDSIEALLQHLYELNITKTKRAPINLTHWFQNTFAQGWQIYNDFLNPRLEPAMSFRSPSLTGRKPIILSQQSNIAMDLVMTLVQKPDHRTRIEIQILSPDPHQLPQGLALQVLDEQDKTFLETHLSHPTAALKVHPFTGAAGEKFTLAVHLEEAEFRESFIA